MEVRMEDTTAVVVVGMEWRGGASEEHVYFFPPAGSNQEAATHFFVSQLLLLLPEKPAQGGRPRCALRSRQPSVCPPVAARAGEVRRVARAGRRDRPTEEDWKFLRLVCGNQLSVPALPPSRARRAPLPRRPVRMLS